MDEPEQRTPPENKPVFVAGLPDAPLERPGDFPDYDGPLVCPFYGPDHPARRDEESKEAFNEDVARVAFHGTAHPFRGLLDLVRRAGPIRKSTDTSDENRSLGTSRYAAVGCCMPLHSATSILDKLSLVQLTCMN